MKKKLYLQEININIIIKCGFIFILLVLSAELILIMRKKVKIKKNLQVIVTNKRLVLSNFLKIL